MTEATFEETEEAGGTPPGIREGSTHGSWHSYLIGFGVSAFLTMMAFWFAGSGLIPHFAALAAISVLAVAQMLVHLIFFLHINTAPQQKLNIGAFALTSAIILIIVVGSLWIMAHLNSNMMPMDQLMKMQR